MEIIDRSGDPEYGRSWDEPRTEAELYALGFRRIGALGLREGDIDSFEDGLYDEADTAWFRRNAGLLTPIYGGPDGAFAEVSRFFGNSLAIRMRTCLADGSVVQTSLPWGRLPNAVGLAGLIAEPDTHTAQMRGHSERKGCSLRVHPSDDTAALFAAHREHVAAVAARKHTEPRTDTSMAAFMRVQDAMLAHNGEMHGREVRMGAWVWLGPAAALLFCGSFSVCLGVPSRWIGFLMLLNALAWPALTVRVAPQWGRRLARAFRVPVLRVPG
ncbi:MAG: hypothetical protein R3F61_25175 [Myxococcota bacterium]